MENVVFMLDSLADLPPSLIAGRSDIVVLDVPIIAVKPGGEEVIFNHLTADTFAEADELVQQGWVTKTSMPKVYASEHEENYGILSVERATREAVKNGKNVVYLAVNSEISGAFQAISALFEQLNEEFGAARAICVDSGCASTGLAMLLGDLLKEFDRLGHYAEGPALLYDIKDYVRDHTQKIAMIFSWFEFEYVKNSGKVAALPAFLGKIFGIHPIGSVEYREDGSRPLITFSQRIRGTKRFFSILARFVSETIAKEDDFIIVAHGNCAEKVAPLIRELSIYIPKATILHGPEWRCGAAIQAHGGPTSIHVNYHRKTPNSFAKSSALLHKICARQ